MTATGSVKDSGHRARQFLKPHIKELLIRLLAKSPAAPIFRKLAGITLPAGKLMTIANVLSSCKEYQAAIALLDAAAASTPDELRAQLMKGQILAVRGDLEESIKLFEAIDPDLPGSENATESLVHLYITTRRYEQLRGLLQVRRPRFSIEQWRAFGQALWQAAEAKRNSSIFKDVEDGSTPIEDVEADYVKAVAALQDGSKFVENESKEHSDQEIELLQSWAEKWAAQVAAHHSVLGRLDSLINVGNYSQSQGRMRLLAHYMVHFNQNSFPPEQPPPRNIPANLQTAFTMDGAVELADGWYDSTMPDQCFDYLSDDLIKSFLAHNLDSLPPRNRERAKTIVGDHQINPHPQLTRVFQRAASVSNSGSTAAMLDLSNILSQLEKGKRLALVNELDPHFESMCAASDASITSVRLKKVEGQPTLVERIRFSEWLSQPTTHDIIICRWLVENWGLGRHGEPLDPDGDVRLIESLRKKLAPDGLLYLTLPLGRDRLIFNAGRIYGAKRFQYLFSRGTHLTLAAEPPETRLAGRRAVREIICLTNTQASA